MSRTSHVLTVLSVVAAIAGVSWYAIAATCAGSLPPSNVISGWTVVANTTRSGSMGSQASYNAYDGAVEAMQKNGIKSFAQRLYKHTATGKLLTLDVFQLGNGAQARALYEKKKTGYKGAKPLLVYGNIKERAVVGTLNNLTFGLVQYGSFVAEVTISKASTPQDRTAVRAFLTYVSHKLAK